MRLLLLLFVSILSLFSVAIGQGQAASNTSARGSCIGYDNMGQAFVYVSCLYGGQIQQLCANWGSLFANGSLMAQLPAGLNCSGIMKTTIANCNGNMTCYSAPNTSQNSSINSTVVRNMTSSSNMTASGAPRPLFQPTMPNTALQSIPPQNPYSQQPSNTYPYQSVPPTTYPYSPYQQQQQQQQPVILSHSAYTDSIGSMHIVGEVMNNSPITVNFVKIIVTFYNTYGQVIGTDNTYTEPTDLAPGQRAPFELIESSGEIPMDQVHNYVLSVNTS